MVTIPPGTASGQKLRLKGKGAPMPKKKDEWGDQYVTVKVVVPKDVPEGFDEILDQMDEATGDPRADTGWAV